MDSSSIDIGSVVSSASVAMSPEPVSMGMTMDDHLGHHLSTNSLDSVNMNTHGSSSISDDGDQLCVCDSSSEGTMSDTD